MENVKYHQHDWNYPIQFLQMHGKLTHVQIRNDGDVILYVEVGGVEFEFSTKEFTHKYREYSIKYRNAENRKREDLCKSYSGFYSRIAQNYRKTLDIREVSKYFQQFSIDDKLSMSEIGKITDIRREDILEIEDIHGDIFISLIFDDEILPRVPFYRIKGAIQQQIRLWSENILKQSVTIANERKEKWLNLEIFFDSIIEEYYKSIYNSSIRTPFDLKDEQTVESMTSSQISDPIDNKKKISWNGTPGEWCKMVNVLWVSETNKPKKDRECRTHRSFVFKRYNEYEFPQSWGWNQEKAYDLAKRK